jgi:hypothetical protein
MHHQRKDWLCDSLFEHLLNTQVNNIYISLARLLEVAPIFFLSFVVPHIPSNILDHYYTCAVH